MKKYLLILLLTVTFFAGNVNAQWVQTGLTGKSIMSITSNGNYLYAGTITEGLFQSTNNGTSWNLLSNGLPVTNTIYHIGFSGTNTFAGNEGNGGLSMYKSTNNGTSWALDSAGLAYNYVSAIFSYGNNIFAGTDNEAGIFLSTNGGVSWTAVNNGITLVGSRIRGFANIGSTIFCCDWQNGVYKTMNNGTTWTSVNNGLPNLGIESIAATSTKLFAAISGNGVYQSADNGATWTHIAAISNFSYTDAVLVSGSYIFAAGYGIYVSKDNGASWSDIQSDLPSQSLYSVGANSTYVFVGSGPDELGVYRRTLSSLVGIEELDNFHFTVMPNPSSGKFILEDLSPGTLVTRITVYNSLGESVLSFQPESFGKNISIELSDVPAGFYYIQVSSMEKMSTRKVLVMK